MRCGVPGVVRWLVRLGRWVRASAIDCENSGGGTRTPDTRIMIPRPTPESTGENALSQERAAPGAAARLEDALIDADLEAVIQAWAELPESVKVAVREMVRG